jgi:addiction module RelE/StbE family toxin
MYKIIYTKSFETSIRKFKKDKKLMEFLFKKIISLKEEQKGKFLTRNLSGYKSLRVAGKYRLIFKVCENEKEVILIIFGHRKIIYDYALTLIE